MKNTLTKLRENLKGKIYICFETELQCKEFLQRAEDEGFAFGKINPTKNKCSDIIALEDKKQLSYVGFVGRVYFSCSKNDKNFHIFNYKDLE